MTAPLEEKFVRRSNEFTENSKSKEQGLSHSVEPEGHYVDPDLYLIDEWEDMYNLDMADLRRIPRYLIKMVLKTDPARLSYDHSVYWAWTATFISEHPIRNTNEYGPMIDEFLRLVHFMMLKVRHLRLKMFCRDIEYGGEPFTRTFGSALDTVEWANPSIDPIAIMADRHASTGGFSILDGLVCHHCKVPDPDTGRIASNPVESPWHPKQSKIGGDISFHDKLQVWLYHEANDETQRTLTEINDLSEHDPQSLIDKMTGIEEIVDEELKSTGHLLRVFSHLRDENIHGQQANRIIGSIITTICCLLLWDGINQSSVQPRSEKIERKIDSTEQFESKEAFSATAFFPVDRIANTLDADVLTPSDPRYPDG